MEIVVKTGYIIGIWLRDWYRLVYDQKTNAISLNSFENIHWRPPRNSMYNSNKIGKADEMKFRNLDKYDIELIILF